MSADRFLSRAFVCPLCDTTIPDGDHEALYTKDPDGTEVYLYVGHTACITAEVARLNEGARA